MKSNWGKYTVHKLRAALPIVAGVLALCLSAQAQYPQIYMPKKGSTPATSKQDSSAPSTDIQRKPGATPEVESMSPESIEAGGVREVVFNVRNLDTNQIMEVKGWGQCQKVIGFTADGPQKLRVKIDVPQMSYSGSCDIQIRPRGTRAAYAHLRLVSPEEAKRNADAHRQQAAAAAQQKQYMDKFMSEQAKVGKLWTVQFGNGQKDTWTMFHRPEDQGTPMFFKNTSGHEMQLSHSNGAVNIVTKEGCIMMGQINGNKAQGQVLYGCSQPQGTQFTATIQQ